MREPAGAERRAFGLSWSAFDLFRPSFERPENSFGCGTQKENALFDVLSSSHWPKTPVGIDLSNINADPGKHTENTEACSFRDVPKPDVERFGA